MLLFSLLFCAEGRTAIDVGGGFYCPQCGPSSQEMGLNPLFSPGQASISRILRPVLSAQGFDETAYRAAPDLLQVPVPIRDGYNTFLPTAFKPPAWYFQTQAQLLDISQMSPFFQTPYWDYQRGFRDHRSAPWSYDWRLENPNSFGWANPFAMNFRFGGWPRPDMGVGPPGVTYQPYGR